MNKIFSLNSITRAVLALNNKNVIAYPTESVFGFGCDPDSKIAVLRLLTLKKRSIKKGLILIAACYEQLKPYIDDSMLTKVQYDKIFSAWPGPVTFIFPVLPMTPRWLTGNFNSLAVRVTNHPLVIKLCKSFGKPLVSSSANLNGMMPCRTVNEVYQQFGHDFPVVIGKTGNQQNPSEIHNIFTGERFR